MPKLSEEPLVHPNARVNRTTLGRYTEIDDGCIVTDCEIGDYSYLIRAGHWTRHPDAGPD